LVTARTSYLWQYAVQKVPHLATSALLAMAASSLSLLAGSANDSNSKSQCVATLRRVLAIAPLPLPEWEHARLDPALAIVMIGIEMSDGHVEASHGGVRLISARTVPGGPAGALRRRARGMVHPAVRALREALATQAGPWSIQEESTVATGWKEIVHGRMYTSPSTLALTAPLGPAEVSGYVLHPAHLEASMSQQALFHMRRPCASTWIQSLRTLALGSMTQNAPEGVCAIGGRYKPEGLTVAGSVSFAPSDAVGSEATPSFSIVDVVIGEHDLPASVARPERFALGPFMLTTFGFEGMGSTATGIGGGAAAEEAEEIGLTRLSPQEALRHLSALVTNEVRTLMGRGVHPDDPLMMTGLDSRGGMELRRNLATATDLPVPVTLLYDFQSINAIVTFLAKLVEKKRAREELPAIVVSFGGPGADSARGKQQQPEEEEGSRTVAAKPKPAATVQKSKEAELEGVVEEEEKVVVLTVDGLPMATVPETPEEWEAAIQAAIKEEEKYAREEEEKARMAAEEAEAAERSALPVDFDPRLWRAETPPNPYEERDHPSDLLKVVRPAARQRPFFLAAPGVNSAQAAYFTFVNKYLAVRIY